MAGNLTSDLDVLVSEIADLKFRLALKDALANLKPEFEKAQVKENQGILVEVISDAVFDGNSQLRSVFIVAIAAAPWLAVCEGLVLARFGTVSNAPTTPVVDEARSGYIWVVKKNGNFQYGMFLGEMATVIKSKGEAMCKKIIDMYEKGTLLSSLDISLSSPNDPWLNFVPDFSNVPNFEFHPVPDLDPKSWDFSWVRNLVVTRPFAGSAARNPGSGGARRANESGGRDRADHKDPGERGAERAADRPPADARPDRPPRDAPDRPRDGFDNPLGSPAKD